MTREVQALMQLGEQRLAEMLLEARDEITELRGAARPNHWDKTLGYNPSAQADYGLRDVLRDSAAYIVKHDAFRDALGQGRLADSGGPRHLADRMLAHVTARAPFDAEFWNYAIYLAMAGSEALHSAEVVRVDTGSEAA